MRSLAFSVAFLMYTVASPAQDVFSNSTNVALEKVIRDFPNRFHNIRGEVVAQHTKSTEYKSTIQVPGFFSCVVTHYSGADNEAYSWNCTAYQSRDFTLARNRFKEIYDQIENTIIKVDGEKPFIVSGQYRTPYEERKLTNIDFELLPATGEMKNMKIELILQNLQSEWKVSLNVYDGDRKIEGSVTSN
ncbi:MAG TPA: hypothetical protein VMI35_15385 [Puia sp.]|nr:hypothetical protein [Puia sp.]